MRAWLDGLDDDTRKSLRDDVTPLFKELPTSPATMACDDDEDNDDGELWRNTGEPPITLPPVDEEPPRMSEGALEVLDVLRRGGQTELFPEFGKGLHGVIMSAARTRMPLWQFKCFVLWFRGLNRNRIARTMGMSRSTVRSALDGEGRHGGGGALGVFACICQEDRQLREAVMRVATRNISKTPKGLGLVARGWFKGIDNKPGMVEPLALLAVLDDLATGTEKREVSVADVLPHFSRSRIQPALVVLKALGYVSSDGHVVRIHRTPTEGATP